MARAMSTAEAFPERWTVDEYMGLVERGVLGPDDRVELLEGVIVAMPPQNPRHSSGCSRAYEALRTTVGGRAFIRSQLSLVLGERSVPEPDLAVVPGKLQDYDKAHPTTALLVIEVADSSLLQDRLTKAAIYAAAEIPEYWIVNLVDDRVEIYRSPEPSKRHYRSQAMAGRGESIEIVSLPGARVAVNDLLPGH